MEYDIFRVRQDREYVSEFDKQIEKYYKNEQQTYFSRKITYGKSRECGRTKPARQVLADIRKDYGL